MTTEKTAIPRIPHLLFLGALASAVVAIAVIPALDSADVNGAFQSGAIRGFVVTGIALLLVTFLGSFLHGLAGTESNETEEFGIAATVAGFLTIVIGVISVLRDTAALGANVFAVALVSTGFAVSVIGIVGLSSSLRKSPAEKARS